MITDDRTWTIDEVAEFLQVPVGTLYQWRTRRIGPPGHRAGKYVRYLPEEVKAWLREKP